MTNLQVETFDFLHNHHRNAPSNAQGPEYTQKHTQDLSNDCTNMHTYCSPYSTILNNNPPSASAKENLDTAAPTCQALECQDANSELELSLYSLSALDKENSLESSLHWSTYLYIIYLVCALSILHSQPNHV